jgi:hypothetical protein
MHTEMLAVTDQYLRLLAQDAPGLVTGLAITGSLALGDYRPPASDIDFVSVLSRDPQEQDLVMLATVHARLPAAPHFDGIYLTAAQLAGDPADLATAPQVLANAFEAAKPGGQLNPVTWLELLQQPLIAGGELPPVTPPPMAGLRRWLLGNLDGYWSHTATGLRAGLDGLPADQPIPSAAICWVVLGPGRLHHTLATGTVTSKTDAGWYTAQLFPAWTGLLTRAISARAGDPVEFTVTDARNAADLVEAVVSDAMSRHPSE